METFNVDFVKYNRERLPQYRTETSVLSSDTERWVIKRALTAEGMPHVLNMVKGANLLRTLLRNANVPVTVPVEGGVRIDYIDGRSIEDELVGLAMRGDREGFVEAIQMFRTFLETLGLTGKAEMNGTVKELLAGVPDSVGELMPVANLDLTFDNVIVDGDGRRWITDQEWVFDSPVPISFLMYRSLYVMYLKNERRLGIITFPEALIEAGVPEELWEPYQHSCERFIDLVLGKDRPHLIPSSYIKAERRLADRDLLESREQQLYAAQLELEATKGALAEMMAHAKVREERLQEQERRLGVMTDEMEGAKASLAEREGRLESLRIDLESLRIDLESERLRNAAAQAQLELERGQRDEIFAHLQDMNEKFMSKQAELMTMSDWARSMQLRLEFMESIPTIRVAERVAKVQKLGVEKLRSEGLIRTMKDLAFSYSPQQLQQMFYHQEASNIKDLMDDASGRNVLVVFPVIPWEFRWQRPQQLVSRFAENGYTVIFVNMTLTAKGARYLSNAEALKDVKLGKLRDHVFEVHLSTQNKINVYQDQIKGGDLNNLGYGLLSVLRELEPASVTYLVQFPGWGQLANVARSRIGGTLVFDCMDDHAGFSNNSTEVVKRETMLMESADLVVTSSAKLYDKALAFNDNSILVRNGTDFEMFRTLFPNGKLDSLKGPIIGYHGAISEWFDPGVVQRCAEKHPEWNFVLIGSTLGCEVNGLKKLTNVQLLGEMPYKDLPGYLYYFNVCIIPFRVCELTLATNPVKFYEYISSGKPVVSVKLPEMEQYADVCYLYETDEEFERGIVTALAEKDEELRNKRIEVARRSSWDQRFQDVNEHLKKMSEGQSSKRKVL
ncbi:MAG TPA: glycosyltransferase [Methanomassiliicoccales archaeon]|nr:glycosyltransferase [Methanomassiliicoccales archaeon]